MGKRSCSLSGSVFIKPEDEHLEAQLDLVLPLQGESECIRFELHEGLDVQSLTGDNVGGWEYRGASCNTFAPEAREIAVELKEQPPSGMIDFTLSYSGKIEPVTELQINRISSEWVELGLYSPWFPLFTEGGSPVPVCADIDVDVAGDYQVLSNNSIRKEGEVWHLSSHSPTQDIVLLAAPIFYPITEGEDQMQVSVHTLTSKDGPAARELAETGLWLLNFYRDWFSDDSKKQVTAVVAPRVTGGGYVRGPFLVLSENALSSTHQIEVKTFKWLAHEFAHLWCSGAPADSWEDWLNESLAEYSALRAVAARYSIETSEKMIDDKRNKMKKLPAIKELDRGSPEANQVLNDKGCVLLHELASDIGRERFTELLRILASREQYCTEQFLGALVELTDIETAREFDRALRL